MVKKTTIILVLFFTMIISESAFAGLHGLTHHSRANCGNNESISWHALHSYWFWVNSLHMAQNGKHHSVVTGWVYTWRAAAVHWGEGRGGWMVEGHHWMKNNIKKFIKIMSAMMFLAPGFSFAESDFVESPFPGAKKGINIWTIEKIKMPMKEEAVKRMKFYKAQGYNETNSTDEEVNTLFEITKIAAKETRQNDRNLNPLDTHLRSTISKLKLSFNFSGIPGLKKENVLGFAPAGGYTHEKGWDGVVEFVALPNLGICSFTTFTIEKVILYKEDLEYLVNKKPSDKNISGNRTTGFLYEVNWYTPDRRNSLVCANKVLNLGNMKKIIKIANQIDSVIN